TVLLALIGFTLFGPDALLTGAGAIDIGGRQRATFAAAVISGFGSTGAVLQEQVIGRMYDAKGGELGPIFLMLFGSAAMAPLFVVLDGALAATPQIDALWTAAQDKGARACMALLDGSFDHVARIIGTGAVTNLLVHPMPVLAEELTISAQKLVRNDLFGADK